MGNGHIFNKETDSEKLAMDIIEFLKKWGLWKDVQIFTGGKCYSYDNDGLQIRNEAHPEKYLEGLIGRDCNGNSEWKEFSNPERLLDMTFEGPLCLLLRHHEYEVNICDVSDEVKHLIIPETDDGFDEISNLVDEFLEDRLGWDPAEYDSYEEWLELNEFVDITDLSVEPEDIKMNVSEFSSREEYEDFLLKCATIRELKVWDYFEDYICDEMDLDNEMFFDDGKIATRIINEFDELLERYGLWYELGFSWSLTTYMVK